MSESTEQLLGLAEMAARSECNRLGGDDRCEHPDCVSCRAAALLPELRCACGLYALDRRWPSMRAMSVAHEADQCVVPPPPPPTKDELLDELRALVERLMSAEPLEHVVADARAWLAAHPKESKP